MKNALENLGYGEGSMPPYITPRYIVYGILINFLMIWIAVGCTVSASKQPYENLEAGIRLEKPSNWELAYSERNGITYLVAESGVWDKDTVQIQIHGPACFKNSSQFSTPNEEIESNIQRMEMLYNVDVITVLQEPIMEMIGHNEVTKAVIEIPAPKEGSDSSQIVSVFQIRDGDKSSVMVYVFQSNNDALNVQAEEIVESLEFNCPSAP
jgi:hypothetical protein